jgi:hypothetical protein
MFVGKILLIKTPILVSMHSFLWENYHGIFVSSMLEKVDSDWERFYILV